MFYRLIGDSEEAPHETEAVKREISRGLISIAWVQFASVRENPVKILRVQYGGRSFAEHGELVVAKFAELL